MSGNPQPTSATGPSSNTFSPTGSPPLILAFLAIGLFCAALVFIFWRRVHGNRGWRLTATPLIIDPVYFNSTNTNVDVPKLWNLSNGGIFARGQVEKEGAGPSDVAWVNLMPLSVFKQVMHSPVADGSTEPRQHLLNNSLHMISNLNPLSWWNRRQSPSSSRHDVNDGDEKESDDEVTVRVAITIALPSPEHPIYIKKSDKRQEAGEDVDRQNMTDYCIGTYERPWH